MHQVLFGHIERGDIPGMVALISRHDDVHVEVLGNLKHDRGPAVLPERSFSLRADLGWGRPGSMVLVGGSTHPGEEPALLRAPEALPDGHPARYLILGPRRVGWLSAAERAMMPSGV